MFLFDVADGGIERFPAAVDRPVQRDEGTEADALPRFSNDGGIVNLFAANNRIPYDKYAQLTRFQHLLHTPQHRRHFHTKCLRGGSLNAFCAVFAVGTDFLLLETGLVIAKPFHAKTMVQMIAVGVGIRWRSNH